MISLGVHRTLAIVAALGIIGGNIVRADAITPQTLELLGTTNVTLGLTPIQDSSTGLGRFFLESTLDGNSNAFVFWIASLPEQSFTVDNGQFTFIPGVYTDAASEPDEQIVISTASGGEDDISYWVGSILFDYDLPSTAVPSLNSTYATQGGDEYYLSVPATVYKVSPALPLPEPGSLQVLGVGFGLMAALLCFTRFRGQATQFPARNPRCSTIRRRVACSEINSRVAFSENIGSTHPNTAG